MQVEKDEYYYHMYIDNVKCYGCNGSGFELLFGNNIKDCSDCGGCGYVENEGGMTTDWIKHWINDLISQETIDNMSFTGWMWCAERYSDDELDYMESLWKIRRNVK